MIQDNFILLICLTFFVFSFGIFQYIEILKTKKSAVIQIQLLRNQIEEEKSILKKFDSEEVKVNELNKNTQLKLSIIKTKIVTLDFSFKELIECITRD
ncbi:hypothetical protein [Polaribacter gochangensis]|uniref:hypothetical protein n=1 Tax=Polaribacter gochangensis TaxID=3252903 RepID=UPI003904C65F